MTEDRSTTVAPASSAWRRSSTGTHLAASPKTGSRVGRARAARRGRRRSRARARRGASPRADLDAVIRIAYVRRRQVEVVAGAHQRDDDAELQRELAAQGAHPVEQVAAGAGVDQVDQVGGELELERVDPHLAGDAPRACPATGAAASAARGVLGVGASTAACFGSRWAMTQHRRRRRARNGSLGRPGIRRERDDRAAGDLQRPGAARPNWLQQVGAHVALGGRRG